ncbi:SRPBCC family protein [Rufibacter sp. LB8]|uniref:SRPBCC family protein n=1 Tax=Rufibacter sp. LB8 TaxID=2777781 RepID=UPI00178C4B89|nr:SRPBCC family protein [Rufibacter sp. LB8]
MPVIELRTEIKVPRPIVFDLSRSIDLHLLSTQQTHEKAIAGKTQGLMGLGEWVTWRAKHFGVYQQLTSHITEMEPPHFFVDEMVAGAFNRFRHEHHFQESPYGTLMVDLFDYTSPLGMLGKLADFLFLKKYMTTLLAERNRVLKEVAESDKWKDLLVR